MTVVTKADLRMIKSKEYGRFSDYARLMNERQLNDLYNSIDRDLKAKYIINK